MLFFDDPNVIDFSQQVNLWEFVYAFAGAFFGFGLTVLLECIFNKFREHKHKKEVLKNIKKELLQIKNEAFAVMINKNRYYPSFEPFIPCYYALVQSGDLLIFVNDNYYEALIAAYFSLRLLKRREMSSLNDEEAMRRIEEADSRISVFLEMKSVAKIKCE